MSTDESYIRKMKEFGFKPYGKTKGKFKITYNVSGIPQTEIWESMEMAINAAKRYSKTDEFSDVKIFDDSNKQIIMAKGGQTAKYSIGDYVKTREIKFRSGDKAGQIQYPSIEGEIIDIEPFQNDHVYTLVSSTDGVKKTHKVTEIQILDETTRPYADGGGVGKKPKKRKRFEEQDTDGYIDSLWEDHKKKMEIYENYEIVIVSKELQKDGGKLIVDRFFVSAENEQEAKNIAVKMWEKDMGDGDLYIVNVMTDSLYRDTYLSKNDNLPFSDGGMAKMGYGGKIYKLGDKWSRDFDYEGMEQQGLKTDVSWGVDKLMKLYDSFEDVNFHTESENLYEAIQSLKAGKVKEAEEHLHLFHEDIRNSWDKYEKGGMMAKGGGIYSSDDVYVVKVFVNDELVEEKRITARNQREAKQMIQAELKYL